MDHVAHDMLSFILSCLYKILGAATKGGLSAEQETDIKTQLRSYLQSMSEQQLDNCFLDLEKTRVAKSTRDLWRRCKTLEISNGVDTLFLNVERGDNSDLPFAAVEQPLTQSTDNGDPHCGSDKEPELVSAPVRIWGCALRIVMATVQVGLPERQIDVIMSPIENHLRRLSMAEAEACIAELETIRDHYLRGKTPDQW